MAGSTEEKWTIDKLGSTNWTTWKFQMKHLLLAKGLWGYVDGTEILAEAADAAARAAHKKKSQKAFSTVVMAISTPQIYLVTTCETPKEAWDALKGHFERSSLANKLMLKKQYFRMEMKEGMAVEAHLKTMKELTDRLAAIEAPIAEEDQIVTLLGSLPKPYATLVTALETQLENLTLANVQQSILHEERKMLGSPKSVENEGAALIGRQGPKKGIKCFECGEFGHFRRDCPEYKQRVASKSGSQIHKAKPVEEQEPESDSENVGAFTATNERNETGKWLVDSGGSSHMTSTRQLLSNYREFDKPEKVCLGDGRTLEAVGAGEVHLNMTFRVSNPKRCVMNHVLFVPKLACNLFSVRAAATHGNIVEFGRSKCWIRDQKRGLVGMGTLVDKLYCLDCKLISNEHASIASPMGNSMDIWHQRLGHAGEQKLKEMATHDVAKGLNIPKKSTISLCEACIEGKLCRKPFKPVGEIQSTQRLQRVHSDVCGPIQTESVGGRKYFVSFTDDYSRCSRVYFMRNKSEVLDKFKEFEAVTTNDCEARIGSLRTDNGGEYVSQEFKEYLKKKGIKHELTTPYSPQQNGVAERLNRTLMESARSMLAHAKLPNHLWAEAVATAAYVNNRIPTSSFKDSVTPYEKWYGRRPNLKHLRVFGCTAYAHVPDERRRKLDKKAEKLRFVGYDIEWNGYRLFSDETHRVIIRRDVVFNERDFNGAKSVEGDKMVEVGIPPDQEEDERDTPAQAQPRYPARERDTPAQAQPRYPARERRQVPIRYSIDEYVSLSHESEGQVSEPITLQETLQGDLADEWDKAAQTQNINRLLRTEHGILSNYPAIRKQLAVSGCSRQNVERMGL